MQTSSYIFAFNNKQMKTCEESKGKIRHPKVERERLETEQRAVFIKTAKPGKWNIVIMCCLQYNLVLISNIPQRL